MYKIYSVILYEILVRTYFGDTSTPFFLNLVEKEGDSKSEVPGQLHVFDCYGYVIFNAPIVFKDYWVTIFKFVSAVIPKGKKIRCSLI